MNMKRKEIVNLSLLILIGSLVAYIFKNELNINSLKKNYNKHTHITNV